MPLLRLLNLLLRGQEPQAAAVLTRSNLSFQFFPDAPIHRLLGSAQEANTQAINAGHDDALLEHV